MINTNCGLICPVIKYESTKKSIWTTDGQQTVHYGTDTKLMQVITFALGSGELKW